MKRPGIIKIFHSYESAQEDHDNETFSMTPAERLSITEHLRRQYFLIRNKPLDLAIKKVIKISHVHE
jgi:hypothetical protein